MKKILFLVTLPLFIGCQTLNNRTDEEAAAPSLELVGSQYQYVGTMQRPNAKSGKSFAAMNKSVAALQWDTVKTLALQHLNAYPGNSDAFLFLAIAHAGLNENSRARFFAELVLKSEPSNAYALNLLGVLKRNEAVLPEDYRRALVYFQLARQSAPQSPTAILNAASLNLEIGNFSEAKTDFKLAAEKCGSCVPALVGSALAAQSLGLFDEAKGLIAEVLKVDENNETAKLLQVGQLYYIDREHEKGQALLAQLLQGDRADSEVLKEARSMMNRIEATAH
ncbi:MAG: hypothetical protein EOP07_14850 [Proteobacteria bacterium]|nr:MAG: hypothetical protein EOP07_14850 [Pseudomonadota bacterium]